MRRTVTDQSSPGRPTYRYVSQRTRRREYRFRLVYGPSWYRVIEPFTGKRLTTSRRRQLVGMGHDVRVEKLSPAGIWLLHENHPAK
jgi:hypothetical protein